MLSVISNFDSRLIGILEGLGASSWFEQVLVSSRVGFAKPDARIFHTGLRRSGIQPGEALHVGDSVAHDLEGADNAGLRGVLIDRGAASPIADGRRISNLKQILEFLDRQSGAGR
jgi:putative hydrolase of the HAD superfamily